MKQARKIQVAVFASGGGTNAEEIIIESLRLDSAYRVAVLIGNNSKAGAFDRALMFGIPTVHLSSATHPEPADYVQAMLESLQSYRTELIVLAGYMKKIPPEVVRAYRGRIINTHPALLPKFGGQGMYGMYVHRAVLAAGESESGVSVHLVDEEYDTGPVIAQEKVPVLPGDTADDLAERIKSVEHTLLPAVVQGIAKDLLAG